MVVLRITGFLEKTIFGVFEIKDKYLKGQTVTMTQSAEEKALAKYIGIFVEGMVEILLAAIISLMAFAFINAFNGLPEGTQSASLIIEYVVVVFIASLLINFVKGLVASFEAFITVLGMIASLWLFGQAIGAIAPDAVAEIVAYIIAAGLGIVLGAYFKEKQNSSGYNW